MRAARRCGSVQRVGCEGASMTEQALAFGIMGLFLFFVALAVSGLEVGTCAQCDHCRDLRRREDEHRRAVRDELDDHYRTRSARTDELARRQAVLRAERARKGRSPDERY
jgi:hypothetical protein